MPSGVMSTRDRMLARAGLEGVTLEAADGPEGVVGVPVDEGAGLAAEGTQEVSRTKYKILNFKEVHFNSCIYAVCSFKTI